MVSFIKKKKSVWKNCNCPLFSLFRKWVSEKEKEDISQCYFAPFYFHLSSLLHFFMYNWKGGEEVHTHERSHRCTDVWVWIVYGFFLNDIILLCLYFIILKIIIFTRYDVSLYVVCVEFMKFNWENVWSNHKFVFYVQI